MSIVAEPPAEYSPPAHADDALGSAGTANTEASSSTALASQSDVPQPAANLDLPEARRAELPPIIFLGVGKTPGLDDLPIALADVASNA
ncbi:MAG: hypothetical protein LC737_10990, partial [Chloroflexi bacterium]|nr:hypothetical protein [Chloroflexota bacterium]